MDCGCLLNITEDYGINMNKRSLITAGIASMFYSLMATKSEAIAFTYVIPSDVSKIKIKSIGTNGKIIFNYSINVKPGQMFEVSTQ